MERRLHAVAGPNRLIRCPRCKSNEVNKSLKRNRILGWAGAVLMAYVIYTATENTLLALPLIVSVIGMLMEAFERGEVKCRECGKRWDKASMAGCPCCGARVAGERIEGSKVFGLSERTAIVIGGFVLSRFLPWLGGLAMLYGIFIYPLIPREYLFRCASCGSSGRVYQGEARLTHSRGS